MKISETVITTTTEPKAVKEFFHNQEALSSVLPTSMSLSFSYIK